MLLLVLTVACSRPADGAAGSWLATQQGQGSALHLHKDGNFVLSGVPAGYVCSDEALARRVEAEGRWEYEGDDRRLMLTFSRYSDARCTSPYVLIAFQESEDMIVMHLHVDDPGTALVFRRQR